MPSSKESEIFGHEDEDIIRASFAIQNADAVLVVAGSGMSVESGLRNFGGEDPEMLWQVYPALRRKKMQLKDCSHPFLFEHDPHLAWGFYGARYETYRDTSAHDGYECLLEICRSRPAGHFVLTTNVDAHFEKAGFDSFRVYELHGTLSQLCCTQGCFPPACSTADEVASDANSLLVETWPAAEEPAMASLHIDQATLEAANHPTCPRCGAPARPLRVGLRRHRRRATSGADPEQKARLDRYERLWNNSYSARQERRLAAFAAPFLAKAPPTSGTAPRNLLPPPEPRLVVIEIGAGSAASAMWDAAAAAGGDVAALVHEGRVAVVRINPEDGPAGPVPAIHIRSGATPALRRLAHHLRRSSGGPPSPPVFLPPPSGPPPPSAPPSAPGSFSGWEGSLSGDDAPPDAPGSPVPADDPEPRIL